MPPGRSPATWTKLSDRLGRTPGPWSPRCSASTTPGASGRSQVLQASLELYSDASQSTVAIDGRAVPLEVESTAALAWTLSQAPQWRLERRAFFFGDLLRQELPPNSPLRSRSGPAVSRSCSSTARFERRPVGRHAQRSPERHPRARSIPVLVLLIPLRQSDCVPAMLLRDALTEAVAQLDPEGVDRALHEMVLIGHSQGACSSR